MACTDSRYQGLIVDLVAGKLSNGELFQVHSHLNQCLECRETVRTAIRLAGKEPEVILKGIDAHVSESQLARFYADLTSIGSEEAAAIRQHLAGCDICRGELELLEKVEGELADEIHRSSGYKIGRAAVGNRVRDVLLHPVAVAAMTLMIAVPSLFVMFRTVNTSESEPALLPKAIILQERVRSTGRIQKVIYSEAQTVLHIAVPIPHTTQLRRYSVELRYEPQGQEIDGPIWMNFDEPGKIDLIIGVESLREGNYSLTISDISLSDPTDSLSSQFVFDLEINN